MPLPKLKAIVMRPHDSPHPVGLPDESRVPQQPTNEQPSLLSSHIQPNQAVGRVTELTAKEVLVTREEGWLFEPMQQCQDVVVPQAQPGDVLPDHPAVDTPGS